VKHLGQANVEGLLGPADDTISHETAHALRATIFPSGALAYAKVGAALMLGRVRALPTRACLDNNMAALIPDKDMDPRFLYWAMSQVKFDYLVNPGAVPSLSDKDLSDYPLLIPDRDEQQAISAYLDRETAQIDELTSVQFRLIEMLQERRVAMAVHAIAGVDQSGLTTDKLGRHTRIGNGSTPRRDNRSYWDGGAIPWLNSAVVNQPRIFEADQFVTDVALAECHLPIVPPGSVLVGLTGQGRTRGMAAILDIESTVSQHLAYVTPHPQKWDPSYLRWSLAAKYGDLRRLSDENGSTKGGLTCEQLKQLRIARPPIAEQRRVVRYLDDRTRRIDALIMESERFIELARERRSALITAAVTGQIDVREAA
jgi:type I restriction enzyme S subunit